MGKRYLVEEIEGEDILETILGGIILIGIIVLVNYFIFKSLGENILRLNNWHTIDPEVLGILIGIFISTCIGLLVFIYKWIEGYEEAVPLSGKVMLCASAILMVLSSIIVPAILYYIVYGTINFEWMDLLKTLILNTILLLIATPLVTVCELIIVVVIGSILSFIIYKTLYFIKSFRIKKTIPWQKILEFNEEENIREHTRYMQVYPEKIEFYDRNRRLQNMISFKRLGYSKLKPLMRLTLIDCLSKKLKTHLQIVDKYNARCGHDLFVLNMHVEHKLKKGKRQLEKQERDIEKESRKRTKRRKKEELKKYKKAVKEGKDW